MDPDSAPSGLDRAREAFRGRVWTTAYDGFAAAQDAEARTGGALGAEDLEAFATTAYLVGRDARSHELMAQASQSFAETGDLPRAAESAFWLGFLLMNAGEGARAGGWFARVQRLLDDGTPADCAQRGYLGIPPALRELFGGNPVAAEPIFAAAAEIGRRHHDSDLVSLALIGQGQARVASGRIPEGLALLDEVMVAVVGNEVSPLVAGLAYCSLISTCQGIFDMRRAGEWTAALSRWCDSQQGLVPYRGQCLVHRSEILLARGSWSEALVEAERARDRLSDPGGQPAIGMAYHQLGEVHRMRGELTVAEECYRRAHQLGHEPQPGLTLLRLAQGRTHDALAAVSRLVDPEPTTIDQPRMLAAAVEVLLAGGDTARARTVADQLRDVAARLQQPWSDASAALAEGAVLLAEGDARAALTVLRRAFGGWRELDMPYDAARTRVLLGLACRALGDQDAAGLELDAARQAFHELGAAPDVTRVDQLAASGGVPRPPGPLTARELEVLALVSAGKSNREIAGDLVLSEKTVARHVSNILGKLALPSRSAATAYAYQHDLV